MVLRSFFLRGIKWLEREAGNLPPNPSHVTKYYSCISTHHGRTKGRTSRPPTRGTPLYGALIRRWNNRNYGVSKDSFPQAKIILWSTIWVKGFKKFRQPYSTPQKSLKNSGCQIIRQPGAPNYWPVRGALAFGPALISIPPPTCNHGVHGTILTLGYRF